MIMKNCEKISKDTGEIVKNQQDLLDNKLKML